MELLINNLQFQTIDSNGDPMVGGKLYTYSPGTTTPLTTYSDQGLSVANTNPVILDSRGEAKVFCSDIFKMTLKDSDDTEIWTFDNVTPKVFPVTLVDTDGDTKVEVEKVGDEDKIRFTCAGTEILQIGKTYISGAVILDEADMASDSSTALATQSSIKAFATVAASLSIPSGEILLFEKDTAVVGYTLLTSEDDMLVYITSGHVAGGEYGSTDKTGGTWTFAGADVDGHTLVTSEIPAHNHTIFNGGDLNSNLYNGGIAGTIHLLDTYYNTTNSTGGGGSHSHGMTGNGTWRPPGRNFTRQQRI